MLVSQGERYSFKLIKREKNSAYEYKEITEIIFKGRPANTQEKRSYRITKGVNGSEDSVYILATNMPKDIEIGDFVWFLNKKWTVVSVGYYYDSSRLVNANLMNEEYIISRCPKGINLQ